MTSDQKAIVWDVAASLLRRAWAGGERAPGELVDFFRMTAVASQMPQAELARRTDRSVPAIARLVDRGVLHAVRGKVRALDAAVAEVALFDAVPGERGLRDRVLMLTDWLADWRDPALQQGLDDLVRSRIREVSSRRLQAVSDVVMEEFYREQALAQQTRVRRRKPTARKTAVNAAVAATRRSAPRRSSRRRKVAVSAGS